MCKFTVMHSLTGDSATPIRPAASRALATELFGPLLEGGYVTATMVEIAALMIRVAVEKDELAIMKSQLDPAEECASRR